MTYCNRPVKRTLRRGAGAGRMSRRQEQAGHREAAGRGGWALRWRRQTWLASPGFACGPGAGDGPPSQARMVARGGSWYDRPKEAASSFRRSHLTCHQAFDVGFRVACEAAPR